MKNIENLSDCILNKYPQAIVKKDFIVSIHNGGESFIDFWNDEIGEQPTEAEFLAVKEIAKKTAKFRWIRKKRTNLLKETDWMSGSDITMSDAWKKYRQDLRDLPASNADPEKIIFPAKPE